MKTGKRSIAIAAAAVLAAAVCRGVYLNNPASVVKRLSTDKENAGECAFKIDYLGFLPVGGFTGGIRGQETVSGIPVYHLNLKAATSGVFDYLFRIRLEINSYVDSREYFPVKLTELLERKDRGAERKTAIYDQKYHILETDKNGEKEKRIILPDTYDHLSLFFLFFKKTELAEGKRIELNLNTNQQNYEVRGEVKAAARYDFRGKPVTVWKIKGTVHRRVESPRYAMVYTMFVMDEPVRMPILIKVSSNLGPVSLRLVSIGRQEALP